jgi:2-pyrone-4,6-dicarboxylate lactonase
MLEDAARGCGNLGADAVTGKQEDFHLLKLPKGAADCHLHVFGPYASFPLAPERAYNVAEAPLEAHEKLKRELGFERTVLVQASGHGYDNRALLSALSRLGERGRAVVVLSQDTSPGILSGLHKSGVRGVRLNIVTLPSRHGGDPSKLIGEYERMLAPLGWHLQIFADAPMLLSMENSLRKCEVPVVIDHMGLPDAAQGLEQPGFKAMLRLMEAGHVWVKLAGADRITRASGRLRDAVPYMKALVAVAPERLVWGSDWPHIGFHPAHQVRGDEVLPFRDVPERELLEVLFEAVPDEKTREAIFAGNPARLYGFG